MKHIIFLFLFVLAVYGCKTTKLKTERVTTSTASAKLDISTTTATTDVKKSASILIDSNFTNEITEWETNIKTFSAPDSLGKQHTTSETNTKGSTKKTKQNNMKQAHADSSVVTSKTNIIDKSKVKANAKTKAKGNKEEEIKSPAWVSIGVIVGIVGLLFLVYLILKRLKILK